MSSFRRLLTLPLAAAAALLPAAGAGAATTELVSATLTASDAERQSCITRPLGEGPAVAARSFSAPATGWLTARLDAAAGDWDVGVFERGSGERVAGAAAFGAIEVAQGIVLRDREYVVQACRRSGDGRSARVVVGLETFSTEGAATNLQLVRVSTPTRQRVDELGELGLDLVEHRAQGNRLVVLHGPQDADTLRRAGFQFVVVVDDLLAKSAADRRAEARAAAAGEADAFPSGQSTYRRLADYEEDLKELAERYPNVVKPFTLPRQTYEGRPVQGIELATDVHGADGRPSFLMMGLHHAREWPSGEHAIEWAYELLAGLEAGDPRATRLLRESRTLVVPVVNPDGFNASREAGQRYGHGDGDPEEDVLVAVLTRPEEYRRKNCRNPSAAGDGGRCLAPGLGLAENGVDPNRNYGGFWGGPGASSAETNLTYRGPGPFSEPETQNVRSLFLGRPISLHLSNHTFSNLWLRPPGVSKQGLAPDEPLYKRIGDAAAAENGYQSLLSYQLYDTTGGTEDWTYWTAGSLGYTPEIGCQEFGEQPGDCAVGAFHPLFERTIDEWEGDTAFAQNAKEGGGGGNREAYYLSQEAALSRETHSVLAGQAPAGATLRLRKSHETQTSQEGVTFEDVFDHATTVPANGRFEWHVAPSTRPLAAQERGRPAQGEPSEPIEMEGTANPGNQPCADYDTSDDTCFDDHPFEVPAQGGGVDNASMSIRMQWGSQASDWDLKVFRDVNGNGVSDSGDELVGASGQFPTNFEQTTVAGEAFAPGKYVARAINYAAFEPYTISVSFEGPEEFKPSETESWTLTCEVGGEVRTTQPVVVARGELQQLNLSGCATRARTDDGQPDGQPGGQPAGGAASQGSPAGRASSCTEARGFRWTKVRRARGGRGLRISFARRTKAPVTVDVFQVSRGREILGNRKVASFRGRRTAFTWSGKAHKGQRARNGFYFVRFRVKDTAGKNDVRRHTVTRRKGRFAKRAPFYRRESCDLLYSTKLERPVFGGRHNQPQFIVFRVEESAAVTVSVRRGTQRVKTFRTFRRAGGRTHRLRLPSEGLARGVYRFTIVAKSGDRRVTRTLTARRL